MGVSRALNVAWVAGREAKNEVGVIGGATAAPFLSSSAP